MAGTTRLELATSAVTRRHPKSLQVRLRHRYCVPRRVPRAFNSNYRILFETQGSDVGSTPTLTAFWSPISVTRPQSVGKRQWLRKTASALAPCVGYAPGKISPQSIREDVLMEPCASAVAKCIPTRT